MSVDLSSSEAGHIAGERVVGELKAVAVVEFASELGPDDAGGVLGVVAVPVLTIWFSRFAAAGPSFAGTRISDRARDHSVILTTAADLSDLVRQYAASPLDLDAYRELFASAGGDANL